VQGLAAAAAIVLAFLGGLAVSRAELRVRDGEVAFRFGAARENAGREANADIRGRLARLEEERRQETLRVQPASTGGAPVVNPNDVLARVQQMIRESETRQAVLLQTGLTQLGQQQEAQRRYDLARISAGLSYLETKTGADVARTNELMMSHVLKATDEK
jgi:hypothetical protein